MDSVGGLMKGGGDDAKGDGGKEGTGTGPSSSFCFLFEELKSK
jgi:hypothetical protein